MSFPFQYFKLLHRKSAKRTIRKLRSYSSEPVKAGDIKILGIETSCDDTGCAVVNNAGKILGESLFSQNATHIRYGGVNPVVAHELHRENIEAAVSNALDEANLTIPEIDAIAVTTKPGLFISLKVGVMYAKFLSKKYSKSIIPIHHMEAHALVARMYYDIPFPFLVLLISGGDCILAVARDVNDFVLLGRSVDNAPGEVLDKVARRMKLRNIPEFSKLAGGQAVELAARCAGNPSMFEFPTPLVRDKDCNFSFSGLKDSLMRKLYKKEEEHGIQGDELIPEVSNLCAAFQLAIAEHLVHRTERAMLYCEKTNLIPSECRNLVVSGGVASNNFLFKSLEFLGNKVGYKVYRPPPKVCTDNGIMIAWNGVENYRKGQNIVSSIDIKDIDPVASLGKKYIDDVKLANLQTKVTRLKMLLKE